MSDTLDDLAAFLMHRTADAEISEERRLSIFVLVDAYQEQDDPPSVTAALRSAAGAFADHPDYRAEWAVREGAVSALWPASILLASRSLVAKGVELAQSQLSVVN